MTLIAEVFPKLQTPKHMVTSMSKKFCFKGSFGKQYGKRAQTLLKLAWQYLYHIYWSLWRQLTCKKSVLVTLEISSLLPNTRSANSRYSLLNRNNLTQPIQMQLSRKQKPFSEFFSAFLKAGLNFQHFRKKKITLIAVIFPKLRTTKNLVRSISKEPVPRDPSESSMVKATKHCWKLHGSAFTIFIDYCEGDWFGKSLSQWYAKSQDIFLTHWVPLASIPFLIETI